jgi:hypothetical protein
MPTVRQIVNKAETNDYRLSSFIKGVVNSQAFKMKRIPELEAVASVNATP